MAFDSLKQRLGGSTKFAPMQIAHHPLFTAREKLDLLHQLKAEVTGERANPDALGFEPEEIDRAIEAVKLGVQHGVGTKTALPDSAIPAAAPASGQR
jgi:hypothetical protein